jgi:hypothetical protein
VGIARISQYRYQLHMAQKHGFFADENLTVIEVKTAGSTLLFDLGGVEAKWGVRHVVLASRSSVAQ